MKSKKNCKLEIINQINQEQQKLVEVITNLEKEINELKLNIIKKEMLIDDLNTKLEEI